MNIEIIEESALAMAQSTIQGAITGAGLTRAELARRLQRTPCVVSQWLSGRQNLTVKTMARMLAVCGYEVRFAVVPITSPDKEQAHG